MNIKKIIEPLKDIKLESIKIFLVGFLIAFSVNASTIILKYFIEGINNKDVNLLIYSLSSFIFIYGFTIIYIFSQRKTIVDVEEGIRIYVSRKYIKLFNSINNEEYEKNGNGRYISVFQSGIKSWEDLLIWLLLSFPITFFIVFFSLIQLLFINILLFFILFFLLFVFFYIIKSFNEKILEIGKIGKEKDIENDRFIIRTLNSKFETMQSGNIDQIANQIEKNLNDNKINWYKYSTFFEGIFTSSSIFVYILRLSVYGYFFYLTINNIYDIATLSMLILLIGLLDSTFSYFIRGYKTFIDGLKNIKKLEEMFEKSEKIKNINSGNQFIFNKGKISLTNIDFKYKDKEDYIFKNLNLTIHGGEKIAFIGGSGNGKSTLVKLITGYLKSTNGNIYIDDQLLENINLESFYKNIGYLTQETILFDGTIRENLLMGKNYTDHEIINTLKKSKCDFVFDLKDGIYTEIGERGIMLSGGQRQRLGLAKIILKNPNIIILDEPTSALDSESEYLISKVLDEITKNKTTIIIAHRLKTIKHCDRILVIENGQIIEDGNHDTLIKINNGKYKELVSFQSI